MEALKTRCSSVTSIRREPIPKIIPQKEKGKHGCLQGKIECSPSCQAVEVLAMSSTSMLVIFVGLTRLRTSKPLRSVDFGSTSLSLATSVLRNTADSVSLIESVFFLEL